MGQLEDNEKDPIWLGSMAKDEDDHSTTDSGDQNAGNRMSTMSTPPAIYSS